MKRLYLLIILISLVLAGFSQKAENQVILSDSAPKPIGPFSQAILAGNTLYLSGQMPIDPTTGKMDTLNLESEIRRVMDNMGAILKEAGMTYDDLVKVTIYTIDLKDYLKINEVYSSYFEDRFPAREAIQVAALPKKAHIEISGIAVKKSGK